MQPIDLLRLGSLWFRTNILVVGQQTELTEFAIKKAMSTSVNMAIHCAR